MLLACRYREHAQSLRDVHETEHHEGVLTSAVMEISAVLLGLFGAGAGKCSREELNTL